MARSIPRYRYSQVKENNILIYSFNNCYILLSNISQALENTKFIAVSFPLLFPLYYIVPPVFTNSDKGKHKGKKIL